MHCQHRIASHLTLVKLVQWYWYCGGVRVSKNLNYLFVNDGVANIVECVKFYGITLENKLKIYIGHICNKLSKFVCIIYKVGRHLSNKSLIGLYYSLFYPYLIYSNVLCGGTYSTHLHVVEMLQKRTIRINTVSEYLAHTDLLFFTLLVFWRRRMSTVIMLLMYSFKNREKFSPSNPSYATRHATDPIAHILRLTLTEHSVHYSAARLLRLLPMSY